MNFIVVGCGRFGAELANKLFENGHQVVVVDANIRAFNRLRSDFRGRTVEGDSLSADTLSRAGADEAQGVAVVTNSDTMNAVIGHTVRSHYPNVKQVVVRNYDPAMRDMLEAFGLQTISSMSWGAERVQELMIDPAFRAVFSAGNGEVEIYEMSISAKWDGANISALLGDCRETVCSALTRGGRAQLPRTDMKLQKGDILTVSATLNGIKSLREKLREDGEA
ncbi:MAG: TrkA family potassium uptake protein [Anaerolineales bacterium]|nr:TrkA family potassium uptake protein [Anaerolineales bacterium]